MRSVTASPPEIYQFTEGGPGPDHEAAVALSNGADAARSRLLRYRPRRRPG